MKKFGDNSLAVGFYSLLTFLSTITVNNGQQSSPKAEDSGSVHSLILPKDGLRFTESLVIVGTLDGKLRGLDPMKKGMIRWSTALSDEPMLSSSLNSVQMMNEFTGFRLIPSLDGGLYQFNWDSIEAIPLNADTLLDSSFKLNEGIGLVGGKNIKAMGIDPRTGKVIYSCSNAGCNDNGSVDTQNDILVIKRMQKTVRAVSERTGAERWNFSVGQHKLSFFNGKGEGAHERIHEGNSATNQNIQVSIPDGLIAGLNKEAEGKNQPSSKNIIWKQKFDTPVTAVWLLQDGMLEKLDLLKISVSPKSLHGNDNLPLMYYIGSHEDQLYIHPSDKMEEAVKSAIESMMSSSSGNNDHALVHQARRRIIWKPYLATSASRTPTIVGKTELSIRKPLDYPFDNGHYFYGPLPNPVTDGPDDCRNNNTNTSDIKNDGPQGILMKLKKFISIWWREFLIFLFTTGFFARQIFKYLYKRVQSHKIGSTLSLSLGDCVVQVSRKSDENTSSQSSSSTVVPSQDNFVSRYECDFEHETCLGKGAFGVVFQARNKLDDCQYAVKRIRLPNNHKARGKVMREVKVLATLDHPGIIRYYNSWYEVPPVEWQKDWDQKLKGDSFCPTLTSLPSFTDESDDRQLHEISLSDDSLATNEENVIQTSRSKSSRQRHDTLTVENENSYEKVEWTTSSGQSEGADSSASFNVEFLPHSLSTNTSNNNGRKLNDESSAVVFERSKSSNKEDEDSCSSLSRSKNDSRRSSSAKDNSPLHLLYIQMQLCCRDSLKDWLNSNLENRDYSQSINIFKQLVVAVDYIHQKGHIHRDLKPSNILFAPDGVVKVGDFGLVAACQPSVKEESDHDDSTESSSQNLTGQVGTQLYMSPEQVSSTKYCFRVDIFSLGIIFFELFHVFKTQMERHNVLTAVRKREIPENFLNEMPLQSKLALWLLAEDPRDRPSAPEISSSSLFSELINKLSPLTTNS